MTVTYFRFHMEVKTHRLCYPRPDWFYMAPSRSDHRVRNSKISFFSPSPWSSHLAADMKVCFHVLATVNDAAKYAEMYKCIHPTPGINPTWLQCVSLNVSLNSVCQHFAMDFVSLFVRDINLLFSLLVVSLFGFVIKVMLAPPLQFLEAFEKDWH